MSDPPLHLAYVTTGYPYVSHTFIQNEVLALRDLGVQVDTYTVWRSPRSERRTAADREAWDTTYALRPPHPWHYLRAHLGAILKRPGRYLKTLSRAVRMGAGSPAFLGRHLAYFVQGVVLWDRCRQAGVDHIHAHFANVSSDVALLAALLGRDELTWSYTMHGPTEFYDVRSHRLAEKTADASFVICVSEFARSQLMRIVATDQWDKLHVVHCGVDTRRFAGTPARNGGAEVEVVCVGRLVPEKGQPVLLEAVSRLRAAGRPVSLTVVGDGPEGTMLQALARQLNATEYVSFLGAVPHTEVAAILDRSDVFCLPSFAEGVPIVLMEAMAMALPVVACGVMGIPELISDGVTGRLVRPGSSDDLAAVLGSLIDDPDGRQRLGRAAQARVAAEFELRANAERLCGLYRRLVPRRRSEHA